MAFRLLNYATLVLLLAACNLPQTPATQPVASEPSSPAAESQPVDSAAPAEPPEPAAPAVDCIPGGSQQDINARLRNSGDEAVLCQEALFELTSPVLFTAAGQKLYTEDNPTDCRRAVLHVVGITLATAVVMRDFDEAMLSHVIWAKDAVIRIGLGMGPRVWGCFPVSHPEDTVYGGTVTGNVLREEKCSMASLQTASATGPFSIIAAKPLILVTRRLIAVDGWLRCRLPSNITRRVPMVFSNPNLPRPPSN